MNWPCVPNSRSQRVSDRLAHRPDVPLAAVELLEPRLPRVERRVVPRRIELERREAPCQVLRGPLAGEVGVEVDVGRVPRLAVEVRVAAQALVDAPAEQLVDGLVDGLADDVPARHLDAAEHAEQRDVGPAGVAPAVDVAPEPLDVERVGADHVRVADVLDHAGDDVRAERRPVDLAEPLDAVVGGQLEEDEVAAAEVGRRVADDERLELGDLHCGQASQNTITLRIAEPPRDVGDRLVDLLERIAGGDQLVQLQPSFLVERHQLRDVDLDPRRAHLAAEDALPVVGDRARVDRGQHARGRHADDHHRARPAQQQRALLDGARRPRP